VEAGSVTFRLALDQNFPLNLVKSIRGAAPASIDMRSIREIDPRLADMDDRPLIIFLYQNRYDAIAMNNWNWSSLPECGVAVISSRLRVCLPISSAMR
jgi:hypothetical protein